MATIDKKLIHFNRLADFETRLAAGDIRDYSIVCIKDAKLIWTHGEYYGDLSECLKVTQQTLTDEEKTQVLENLGIEIPTKVSELENDKGFVSAVDIGEEVEDPEVSAGSGTSSGSAAYPIVEHGTSDTTFTLTPNTFHVWNEVASLDLSFGDETSGVANEFLFQFTSGATATTLTLPDDIKWANDTAPTIAENMIYQVSVLRGLASVLEFSNAALISFTVAGTKFEAVEGMTWEEWINSIYNTGGLDIYSQSVTYVGGYVSYDGTVVTIDELIVANRNYSTISTGGAD